MPKNIAVEPEVSEDIREIQDNIKWADRKLVRLKSYMVRDKSLEIARMAEALKAYIYFQQDLIKALSFTGK